MKASYVYAYARGLVSLTGANSGLWNNPNALISAYGRDPRVPLHQIKIQGGFRGPWGINMSGYFRFFSGQPYTRTIRSSDLGLKLKQGVTTIYAEKRGSRELSWQQILDFRLDKTFRLPGNFGTLDLMLDIFNVLNANTPTSVETVSSNPSLFTFEETKEIESPRILRLGVRYEF